MDHTAVSPPCPGLITAWRLQPQAPPVLLDAAAAEAAIAAGESGLWLHFNLADQRSKSVIARLPLPPAGLAALIEPDEAPHLDLHDGALVGAMPDFAFEADPATDADMALLHLALTPGLLVTARRHPLRATHDVAQGPACGTPAQVLAAILLRVTESLGRALQALSGRLAHLEEALLRHGGGGNRTALASIRRRALALERRFAPAARTLVDLAEELDNEAVAAFARPVLNTARRHGAALHAIAAVQERARIAQDEMANIAAERTNRQLFVLSVISAAMLPASLIAGIFGMNVGSVPGVDQEWGFVMAMALIVMSILGILGALRWFRML